MISINTRIRYKKWRNSTTSKTNTMKNLIYLVAIAVLFGACGAKKQTKTIDVKIYSAVEDDGDWVKGEIKESYSTGFYDNGDQKYFIGFIGYSESDTLFFEKESLNTRKEKDGKFTYCYIGDDISSIEEKKGDTIFYYSAEDLEEPTRYTVFESKERPIVFYYYDSNKKETILKRMKENKDEASFLVKIEKYPKFYERKNMTEVEYNVYLKKNTEYQIIEEKYTYYNHD